MTLGAPLAELVASIRKEFEKESKFLSNRPPSEQNGPPTQEDIARHTCLHQNLVQLALQKAEELRSQAIKDKLDAPAAAYALEYAEKAGKMAEYYKQKVQNAERDLKEAYAFKKAYHEQARKKESESRAQESGKKGLGAEEVNKLRRKEKLKKRVQRSAMDQLVDATETLTLEKKKENEEEMGGV